jgi:hypothetical protein
MNSAVADVIRSNDVSFTKFVKQSLQLTTLAAGLQPASQKANERQVTEKYLKKKTPR